MVDGAIEFAWRDIVAAATLLLKGLLSLTGIVEEGRTDGIIRADPESFPGYVGTMYPEANIGLGTVLQTDIGL